MAFRRQADGKTLTAVLNAGDESVSLSLPWEGRSCRDLLSGETFRPKDGALSLTVPPRSGYLLF